MSAFDSTKMSADEFGFIRIYCAAVKKDYDLLTTMRGLMRPENLEVVCPLEATRLAEQLRDMQVSYCAELESRGTVKVSKKKEEAGATLDQIAEVFTQSFFKLVHSETKKVFITDKGLPDHDGWSSGHPAHWQHMLHSLKAIYAQKMQNDAAANGLMISALLKLFSILPAEFNSKNYKFEQYEDDEWDDEDPDDGYFDDLFK
jgi:hypothetical protein